MDKLDLIGVMLLEIMEHLRCNDADYYRQEWLKMEEKMYTITLDDKGILGVYGPTPNKEQCIQYLKYERGEDELYFWMWEGEKETLLGKFSEKNAMLLEGEE